jgi:hypothetical protein
MIRPSDDFASISRHDRRFLKRGIDAVRQSPVAHQVSGWQVAMQRLELAMQPQR